MPLVVTNAVLVRLIYARSGVETAVNVFGATGLGPAAVNQALANTIGANVKGLWTSTGLNGLTPTTFALHKVGVRSIGAEHQAEYLDAGDPVPGTLTADYLPPQIAFCVTLRTALAGQEFRGRTYFCGFTETSNDVNGQAQPGVATLCVAFVDGLRTGQFGAALTLSIISRKLNQANPVTLVQSRNLTWETQRRRAIPGV